MMAPDFANISFFSCCCRRCCPAKHPFFIADVPFLCVDTDKQRRCVKVGCTRPSPRQISHNSTCALLFLLFQFKACKGEEYENQAVLNFQCRQKDLLDFLEKDQLANFIRVLKLRLVNNPFCDIKPCGYELDLLSQVVVTSGTTLKFGIQGRVVSSERRGWGKTVLPLQHQPRH